MNSISSAVGYYDIITNIFGDISWLSVTDVEWTKLLLQYISDISDANVFISSSELNTLSSNKPSAVTIATIEKFVLRWNQTQDSLCILL